jgi:hypothetical protein
MVLPDWFPDSHISSAETISEYLITLRGGAPFLSGADTRLLVQWLDEDIPPPAILSALERVALKRRAKRARTRLSLNATKGELRKLLGKKEPPKPQAKPIHFFAPLHRKILESITEKSSFVFLQKSIAQQLLDIDDTTYDKIKTEKAISLISSFHQQVWDESEEERFLLTKQAENEIAAMRSMIPPRKWNDLVEEIARDHLRSRYPLFSAQMIWDSLKGLML